MPSFSEFSLLPSLQATLAELELVTPTDIQEQSIPELLKGQSLVAEAETGSGKTLAFALPMLHQLKELEWTGSHVVDGGRPRGIVLVPGRELGDQVGRVFKSLTHGTRVRVRLAVGGNSKQVASQNIAGLFEILVATPGRLQQLLETSKLSVKDVRIVVFDEADQLLDKGFLPFARKLVRSCRRDVQLAMFSATMKQSLQEVVAEVFREKPLHIKTHGSNRIVQTLRTDNRMVDDGRRVDVLRKVLREDPEVGTLLFANTRAQCGQVAEWLRKLAILVIVIPGPKQLRQNYRTNEDRIFHPAIMLAIEVSIAVGRHRGALLTSLDNLPVLGMHAGRRDDLGRPLGHTHAEQYGLHDRTPAVVQTGVGDVHSGELGNERLEFEEGLQRPLAGLGLVGRIGSGKLTPGGDVIDHGRDEVVVAPGAQETNRLADGRVARRQL